jgi:uncharacterized surface protein with fasciclin (FAS1) repeats
MKTIKLISSRMISCLIAVACLLLVTGCQEENPNEVFYEEEELLITAYLEEHSSTYSTLLRVLEITNIKSILNAYGHYTFFAPDNNAFTEFCQEQGCGSVDDFEVSYLTMLVKYHLLDIEMETHFLPNGVLPDTSFSGDNLIFSFSEGGLKTIMINSRATITERDIKVENGRIHRIDKVLPPVFLSVYDRISEEPEYSLFEEALKATGLNDTLNVISIELNEDLSIKSQFTLFIESNQVFGAAGINSIDDLITKYSDSEDITQPDNGLNQFMAYHCVPGQYFLNQIDSFNYNTLALNEQINVTIGDDIYLNRKEEWHIGIISEGSNIPAKNGVYHTIDKVMEISVPDPVYIKFEFTDYQGISPNTIYSEKDLEYIDGIITENTGLFYRPSILDEDSMYLETISTMVGWVVEFTLPPITKGRYRVILHWVSDSDRTPSVQAFWDEQLFGTDFSMRRHKRPPRRPPEWIYDFRVFHEIGVVTLTETTSHNLKFISLQEGYGEFDYITFVPF